ncbi:MAG TPA: arginine--tRNA ligase [Rhizomicrobium sp.]|jgi:arginyl-tRNA synthetase|nr:arginine--tRNA ligase [Rhizomicrobium sp.]
MISLLAELSEVAGRAFAAEGFDPALGIVQVSDRPDLAQFQCNGALAAAKAAKAPPRAIAERIAARLHGDAIFSRVELAGPGFINLDIADSALESRAAAMASEERLGAPDSGQGKTLVVDFGGPNVAKPMHVGHLRTAIIGDSLQRLFRANGWRVLSDVHLGDWGLPMGQLISEIRHRDLAPIYFDANYSGPYPKESPVSMEELEELYPAASGACKTNTERLEEARQATAELQGGRPGYRALWRHFFEISEQGLKREFASLGIRFDLWKGEADVDSLIPPMIADLKSRHIAEPSEGALVIAVSEADDRKEIPPLILLKSDGAVLYSTTDLATIVDRVKNYDPDLILYVVDQRQHMHFEQVFRAARKARLNGKAELEHVGYGTVNGTDGKPFKTRAGGVMKLYDLIAMATDEAAKRLREQGLAADYPAQEHAEIAKAVGIAAIKFADLVNFRTSDYVFDLARFTRFEGRTGPYLQYAVVRIQSILRKADGEGFERTAPLVRSPEERRLVLQLLSLTDAMLSAEIRRAPNVLCEFAFALAQEFSRFYAAHHILSESDGELRSGRLGLCGFTLAVLVKTLDILGIGVPARM